jgi:hypothetical protein
VETGRRFTHSINGMKTGQINRPVLLHPYPPTQKDSVHAAASR